MSWRHAGELAMKQLQSSIAYLRIACTTMGGSMHISKPFM